MAKDSSKRVLVMLAHYNFRDEEYTSVRNRLEQSGTQITVASSVKNGVMGSQGLKLNADLLIDDVNPDDYEAVVFIGGTGSSQYWHDIKAHDLANNLNERGKVVAASSHAPVTLAVAGLLKGKKVTGHVTIIEKLTVHGAVYTGKKVETDENIITATGVNAAKQFAETLSGAIS